MITDVVDTKDRNILKELNFNSRQSYNVIAKKTRLSKNQVVYRINSLVEAGIITKFCAVINYPKLGYHYYRYYFKLQFCNDELIKQIIEFVKNLKNIYWVATVEGRFNLIIESLHNRVSHAINNYLTIANEFSDDIIEKGLNLIAYGYSLQNNYIYNDFVSEVNVIRELHDDEKKYKLEEKEKIIINTIKENARIPIVDLAEKTNLSSKTIIAKLKQFEKEKIIVKYRITLDHNKFAFEQHHVFLSLDYKNKKMEDIDITISEFLKQQKSIIRILKPIGNHDLEFRCLVRNNYELISLLKEIRAMFPDIIRSHESVAITRSFPINTVRY